MTNIRYYDRQTWNNLTTLFAPGGDPYASVNVPGFGEYAAMARAEASTLDNIFSNLGRNLEFYVVLAFVLIFGAIAAVQEIRRRSPEPRPGQNDKDDKRRPRLEPGGWHSMISLAMK